MFWNSNYESFISVALDQHIVGACWLNFELINRYIFCFLPYVTFILLNLQKNQEVYFSSQ